MRALWLLGVLLNCVTVALHGYLGIFNVFTGVAVVCGTYFLFRLLEA